MYAPVRGRCVLTTSSAGIVIRFEAKCKNERASCYRSCLQLANAYNLHSIAFCCISTGEFRFPNEEAAQIAIDTVRTYLKETNSKIQVVFNVFKDIDYDIYNKLLS